MEMLTEKKNEEIENDFDDNINHVIMNFLAFISKPFYYMMKMMARLYYIAKKKIKEIMSENDHKETEKEKDLKMKHDGEIKLSEFGLGFEMNGFVAFLSWTGMCLYSILGIAGMILITLPIEELYVFDSIPLFRVGRPLPWYLDLTFIVFVNGIAFLVIAVAFLPMTFLLRKRNKENNVKGVKKMLTMICSIKAVLGILYTCFASLVWFIYEALLVLRTKQCLLFENWNLKSGLCNGILPELPDAYFSLIILIPALVLWCLLVHGIRKGRSGFVKAFLVIQYTFFGLAIPCIFVSSVTIAVSYEMFIIVPCGLLLLMVLTFLFVFNIGFYVVLHSIYLEKEKTQQQMMMDFTNASFE